MGRMGQDVTGSLAGLKPGRSDGDEQGITTPIHGVKEENMTRPPLTIALSSVLAAAIDGAGRPGLLATLHPDFGRSTRRPAATEVPGMAQVIVMPRVIPMPRRGPAEILPAEHPEPDPTSAA